MRAAEVRSALCDMHSEAGRWVTAEEVQLQMGPSHRRLDFVAMDCWESRGYALYGFEVKVSKADLKREIQDPSKHTCFFDCLDYFSIAGPSAIFDLKAIPDKWGVCAIEGGKARWLRKPSPLHGDEMISKVPKGFMASFARKAVADSGSQKKIHEARMRGIELGRQKEVEAQALRTSRLERELEGYRAVYDSLGLSHPYFGEWEKSCLEDYAAFKRLNLDRLAGAISGVIEGLGELDALIGRIGESECERKCDS